MNGDSVTYECSLTLTGYCEDELAIRLRDFAAASSEWFWETDADLRFCWFSEGAAERIGMPIEQLLGRTRMELGSDRGVQLKWQRHYADQLARRPFRNFRYRVRAENGRFEYLSVSGIPRFDPQGRFLGYRGTGCNVTAEEEAEHRVRDAEECLRVAFETSAGAIGITRIEDGQFIEANDAMARLIGRDVADIIGKTSIELGFWQSAEQRQEWCRQLRRKGILRDYELAFVGAHGRPIVGLITASLFDRHETTYVLFSIVDLTESRRSQFELRKLMQAVEQSSAAIIITDRAGRIEFVNPAFTKITGYATDDVLGASPRLLKSGQTATAEYARLWKTITAGKAYRGELCNRRKDGSLFWANVLISPVKDANDVVTHYIGIHSDITDRVHAVAELRASEERFRSLIDTSLLGICIAIDGVPAFVNQTFADIFGYGLPDEVLALGSCDALWDGNGDDDRERSDAPAGPHLPPDCRELRGRKRNGEDVYLLAQFKSIPWKDGIAQQVSVVDISLRKRFEAKLQHQASYDALTGLPNRSLAIEQLEGAVRDARQCNGKFAILFVDFDHFKKINDTFGHATGDVFLRKAAERISSAVRAHDFVARLGGDEFLVVLTSVAAAGDAEAVATRILQRMGSPFLLHGQEVFVGVSVGIALYPDMGTHAEALIQHADAAMYAAKGDGRGAVRMFSPDVSEASSTHVQIETELRWALKRGQLSLVYQPQVDAAAGEIVGVEALLRWSHPTLGAISPDIFIGIAEDTGLIAPIGEWVIRRSCADARSWLDAGHSRVRLSVNVSSRQLRSSSLVATIREALAANRLDPAMLELELTESLMIDDVEETMASLRALDAVGVHLAMDDFGTGYSSLGYLTRLPLDTLKIDRSFVTGMGTDPTQATLVDALIVMAHRLDLRVIAEGIETSEQLAFLTTRNCDVVQGYLFSRPLPLPDLLALLSQWPQEPTSQERSFDGRTSPQPPRIRPSARRCLALPDGLHV